jgi:hypothetical protein
MSLFKLSIERSFSAYKLGEKFKVMSNKRYLNFIFTMP